MAKLTISIQDDLLEAYRTAAIRLNFMDNKGRPAMSEMVRSSMRDMLQRRGLDNLSRENDQ